MKKYKLIILIGFLCAIVNTNAQRIYLENNDIHIKIIGGDSIEDTTKIVIKNKTEQKVLINMIDGINLKEGYLGIGLYSAVFPFTPDHMIKYDKLDFLIISAEDSVVLKQKGMINFSRMKIGVDYILYDEKELTTPDRTIYDKEMSFWEVTLVNE